MFMQRAYLLLGGGDIPAVVKALLNMKGPNAILPCRSCNIRGFLRQAKEVDLAATKTESDDLAKEYGIKETPILSHLSLLKFPASFPPDFMHIMENLIPHLVDHYTGAFKGLDEGHVWEAIRQAAVDTGDTIPSSYGRRIPDISSARTQFTAEAWFVWTTLLAPELLHKQFTNNKYYDHFARLVKLINLCLGWTITKDQLSQIRVGFIEWVEDYERYVPI
ncbi:hypothetical protein BOTBODRAFT_55055 [Botryobasidium botryosum FD-172 SS1]|uniref:Uncharacterized protein n=1 Tax=Botryobasidium botryosum (strain FD-172 SS1) TaxID=930990 RepID=A0A067MSQ5_BOTB1|nr:hypothetical protein BOTBODRAFT_55055 [Botryobasidium botryosum FD-172 SS1]